jgi:hypothetical protein
MRPCRFLLIFRDLSHLAYGNNESKHVYGFQVLDVCYSKALPQYGPFCTNQQQELFHLTVTDLFICLR